MKYLLVIAILILTTSAQARTVPPPPLGSTLNPVDGVGLIGWANDAQADTVIVVLDRDDCHVAAYGPPGDTGDPQQATTQIPSGPPFESACLLRPGDHAWLSLWRAGRHVETIGPYNVPVRIWLPMIQVQTDISQ